MVFSSVIFIFCFLPLFLLVYHIVPKKWKNYVILLFSILFYGWGSPSFLLIMIGSIIVTFYIVRSMYKVQQNSDVGKSKTLMIVAVALNLLLLFYFKYSNFFIENVNAAFKAVGIIQVKWTAVLLPIGISFYTFQSITYVVDVYRKIHRPLKSVADYMLYILAFPQMIAGPIVRFTTIADQIEQRVETNNDKLTGFYRFSIGLAKKILIANTMAVQADNVFSNISSLSTPMAWVGMFAYTMQIYFDFSGYSDMAIGLGKIMGFSFPENFNLPYTSRNISEFWKRWHITLGDFLKDYLYIPLGGNRKGAARTYINLWIVFILCGAWHGAAWTFVIWGVYHGLFIVMDKMFLTRLLKRTGKVVPVALTFFVVMIGWVLFRSNSITEAFDYIKKLFAFSACGDFVLDKEFVSCSILALVFAFFSLLPKSKKIMAFVFNNSYYTTKQHIGMSIGASALMILSCAFLFANDFNPFIYFRF